jgi:L-lactate dehydrogenase complex protein LldF
MNTCPVYRRSGGHSYAVTVPGPIGSILAPSLNPTRHASLPFASSLCGSCTDVCPVKIDLHHQLLAWRKELARLRLIPLRKRLAAHLGGWVLARPWAYRAAGKVIRWVLSRLPRSLVYHRWNAWGRQRELPPMPKQSFRQMYRGYRGQ